MKLLPSLILSLNLIGLWSCSDAGDPISNSEGECVSTGDNLDENGEDCTGTCGGISIIINGTCTNISYALTIQPIFDNNCISCHGDSGGLNLSSYESLMNGGDNGESIIPENSAESILIEKLMPNPSFGNQMDYLNESMINKISLWIELGALEN